MRRLQSLILATCLIYGSTSQILAQGRGDRPTFFRDGQQRMEQEIQRLQQQQVPLTDIEHPSQLLTIETGQFRWQKFLFRDSNFSVWMPQGIQSLETVTLEVDSSQLPFEVYATQTPGYRFVTAYSESLTPSQLSNSSQLLSEVKTAIIQKTNFTLLTDKEIVWEESVGQEFTLNKEDELISFRVYLINQRLYILGAEQNDTAETTSDIVISFFDSFRLLN